MYDIENYISKLNESYGNDQKLGRFVYDIDYMKRIQSLYSKTLDEAGLNVADSLLANMKYFNRTGDLSDLDPPYVGKTFLFMTRPDLNFRSPYNLSAYPIFEYFSKTQIGKYLIGLLQRPGSEMIGGEALNDKYCIKSAFNPISSLSQLELMRHIPLGKLQLNFVMLFIAQFFSILFFGSCISMVSVKEY